MMSALHSLHSRQFDDRRRVDEPVPLVDDADVVDGNAQVLVPTETAVNVPANNDPWSDPFDRCKQFAAAHVLHPT